MKAKKCKTLRCNRKTRTPFCWQHADMDFCYDFEHAPQLSRSLRWMAIKESDQKPVIEHLGTHVSKSPFVRNENDAYITELAIRDMEGKK